MDLEQLSVDMSAALSKRTGCDLKVTVATSYPVDRPRNYINWVSVAFDGSFLPSGEAPGSACSRISTTVSGTDGETRERNIRKFADEQVRSFEKEIMAARTIWALMGTAMNHVTSKIEDLKIEGIAHISGSAFRITWTGYGKEGLVAPRKSYCSTTNSLDIIMMRLEDCIKRIERDDAVYTASHAKPVLIEQPLLAMLHANDVDEPAFLAEARRVSADNEMTGGGEEPSITIGGTRVKFTIGNGRLMAEIKLGETARWAKGRVVVRGAALPEVVATAATGRRMRDIVDHPWLEGMTVSSVMQSTGKKGATIAIIPKAA